ncbi:hypothetical protein GCM10009716_18780 [Streptomyces sodiiphilus]|uniref:TPM domain-containing protein n=1 Tax=Streptomyces sodiiphilus TaxID=226217 RepID=A0ABN2P1W0_9ACTN
MSTDRPSVSVPAAYRRRRIAAALVCAAALACAPVVAASGAARAEEPSRGERIAESLRESPVYTDPAYEPALPPQRQEELARRIAETGLPIHVVLVPLVQGDQWDGDAGNLAQVVYDRLHEGDREPAVLVTADQDFGTRHLRGFEWPDDELQAVAAVRAVGFQDDMRDAGLGARLERIVEIIEAGNGEQAYEEATADLGGPVPDRTGGEEDGDEGTGSGLPLLPLLIAGTVVLAAGGLGLPAARRRRSGVPYGTPRSVHAAARRAAEDELRERARQEVVGLGERLSSLEEDGRTDADALHRALDAYAAAGSVLDRARSEADLAGVLALVTEGGNALLGKGAAAALPLCFFHPLHGRAERRARWRPLGRRQSLRIAVCATCAAAVRAHRPPEVLMDRHDGRDVPYFEVPAERSVWAATGYGSLGGASMTERVRRGDFTRGERA